MLIVWVCCLVDYILWVFVCNDDVCGEYEFILCLFEVDDVDFVGLLFLYVVFYLEVYVFCFEVVFGGEYYCDVGFFLGYLRSYCVCVCVCVCEVLMVLWRDGLCVVCDCKVFVGKF